MPEKEEREGGGMSVREAGHMGGEKRFRDLGHEGMSELGRKGGQRVRDLIRKGKQAEREE